LRKINKLWEDYSKAQGKDASEDLKSMASKIQDEVLKSCLANKSALSVLHTNSLLISAADSRLDKSISEGDLREFEGHIKNNINEFLKADLATTIASLMKLGIMPDEILNEIESMNNLTNLKGDSAFILLR
jgi:hypothetical protein